MNKLRITIITLLLSITFNTQAEIPEFFNAASLKGNAGDTEIALYLGPSPQIYRGLQEFIVSATNSLDICVYDLDLPNVAKLILDKHYSGVKVRLSLYADNEPAKKGLLKNIFKEMESAEIVGYADNRSGIMHNKFIVVDGKKVLTGSYNFTASGSKLNDNAIVILESPELADNYTAEMEEIWNGRFGKRDSDPTPYHSVTIGVMRVDNYFSPEDDLETAIIEQIETATNQIYIMAFSFTSGPITKVLKKKIQQGVTVMVLLDETLAVHPSSKMNELREAGADVRISPNGNQMHHKTIVIDSRVVITGSANFSNSAFNSNDENTLIIYSPSFARAMEKEFKRCWLARSYMWSKWNREIE